MTSVRVLLLLLFAACPTLAADPLNELVSLNKRGTELRPGVVYVIRDDREVAEVVDLLANVRPNDLAAWHESRDLALPLSRAHILDRNILQNSLSTTKVFYPASIYFDVSGGRTTSLNNSFDCLEILNRKATGLTLNLEAERRILAWRRAISNVAKVAASDEKTHLALCTRVDASTDASVRVVGKVNTEAARSVVCDLFVRTNASADAWETVEALEDQSGQQAMSFHSAVPFVVCATFSAIEITIEATMEPRFHCSLSQEKTIRVKDFYEVRPKPQAPRQEQHSTRYFQPQKEHRLFHRIRRR